MIGLNKTSVSIVPYDASWAAEFEKEKQILNVLLKDHEVKIEHVGSTSIKGLAAKPIIDIAVGVKNAETMLALEKLLATKGYDMLNSIQDKGEILARKGPGDCRTHYIHIVIENDEYWNEFIYFKKYLLEHPQYIKQYEKLKSDLSVKYASERKKYTASKNEFISRILKKAYKLYKVK